ncbi:MAG: hypothetical protein J6034_03230 [Bacteroidaceae bacterium]|nr:hypothetical protein [Bacteroidaceae bacterium]
MRKILYTFVLLTFSVFVMCCSSKTEGEKSCKESRHNFDAIHLNDSALMLMQSVDSTKIRIAIQLLDSAISIDTIQCDRRSFYWNKAGAYAILGDSVRYEKDMETAMSLLPSDNLLRLVFYGKKYKKANKSDSSAYYLSRAIFLCDSLLEKKYDESVVFSKVTALSLYKGDMAAKRCLTEALSKHPESVLLSTINENWNCKKQTFDGFMSNWQRNGIPIENE